MASPRQTDSELAKALGERLRRYRLDAMSPALSQQQLASRAGISLDAVKRLESGRNSTLLTWFAVLRALSLLENLGALVPEPEGPSPMQLLEGAKPERQRAPTPRRRTR